ncbi:hypothetical protein FOCG_17857 [Fusarium oxysporum f. sp. radicis-lycopersici 26381]|nr:hypothetical protein FOCG_18063 [Fusarium oxysporum f. sp. radicis-lycopersici 26381]EXL39545.1 hypothetical protein FOCG_17857 [Fusarium oxysporum f. sp. radicis-lycopersici 26381]
MLDSTFISPPFITVPGVPNFRDIGGYPLAASSGKAVRPGIIFRSSEPSQITEEGISKLQSLNIRDIYDLRSQLELVRDAQKGNGRQVRTWRGATRVLVPVFPDYEYTPQGIAKRFNTYASDTSTPIVLAHLKEILTAATAPGNVQQPYRMILQHLASATTDGPSPILVHCSAGKDRTGVICALILSLCGVEDEVVAHEYSLSELGLKSRPEFLRNLLQDPVVNGNAAAAMQMVGSRKTYMVDFLRIIREQWGSVDQCVIGLGLISQDGIQKLRQNMTVDAATCKIQIDWQSHSKLVAEAEEDAEKRIGVVLAQA